MKTSSKICADKNQSPAKDNSIPCANKSSTAVATYDLLNHPFLPKRSKQARPLLIEHGHEQLPIFTSRSFRKP